jgi:hypothetical protein
LLVIQPGRERSLRIDAELGHYRAESGLIVEVGDLEPELGAFVDGLFDFVGIPFRVVLQQMHGADEINRGIGIPDDPHGEFGVRRKCGEE